MSSAGDGWWTSDLVWDVFFVFVAVFTSAVVVLDSTSRPMAARVGAVATVAAVLLWYAAWRRPLSAAGGATLPRYVYLIGVTALFAAGVALVNGVSFLLLMLCPQAYILLPRVQAFGAVVTVNVVYVSVIVVSTGDPASVLQAPLWMAVMAIVFSAVVGTGFSRVSEQNDERAVLIGELEARRAEVARLSHEAGVSAERQRLAGDLHDTLAQGLSSVVMLMQAADADLERAPEQARRHLTLAISTARDNLAEVRALVGALTPAALDDSSLAQAMGRLVDRFRAETGVASEFTADAGGPPLPTAAEVVLLRAVQESLTNVRKHARASAVSVRLRRHEGWVALETRDDGCGLTGSDASGGYGLDAMRRRVEQVSGTVTVESTPGAGTVVRIEVPAP